MLRWPSPRNAAPVLGIKALGVSTSRRGQEAPGNRSLHFLFRGRRPTKEARLRRVRRAPWPRSDLIRYDLLVQDAMREVMRKVLASVAASGYLPGDHHFTISFHTRRAGRENLAASRRAMAAGDDDHPATPVLRPHGGRIRLRRRALLPLHFRATLYSLRSRDRLLRSLPSDSRSNSRFWRTRPGRRLRRGPGRRWCGRKPSRRLRQSPRPPRRNRSNPSRAPPGEPAKIVSIDTFRKKR